MAISLMVLVMMMPMMVTTIMTLLTIFLPWCSTLSPICPQRISAVERLKQWKVLKTSRFLYLAILIKECTQ